MASSLWQLTKEPGTGGGTPEESHAANRASAALSRDNLAWESSNVLRAKKFAKGSFQPAPLAAGIWVYAVADPVPSDAPEALARAQLSDNIQVLS